MLISPLQGANTFAITLILGLWSLSGLIDGAPHPRQAADIDIQGSIEILKSKQPDTPPKSLPSDPFAKYKFELNLGLDGLKPPLKKRTIIVGDVHGSLGGLNNFLTQLKFNQAQDTIILAGDITAKGPQSLQVIDRAIAIGAKCVRGNHDDKVIRWKGFLDSGSKSKTPSDLVEGSDHQKIAKGLSDKQYKYLLSCPLILTLPKEVSKLGLPIHVIHAGLDPKKALKKQQPWVLFNVRNILKDGTPSRKKKEGKGWSDVFNDKKPSFRVVYGHDAGRGLSVKTSTVGLDTGCVYGKELSGYIVELDQVKSVKCPNLGIGDDED
ncbi:hypothetical protein BGX34_005497 [Mortierella sp. NVP85]|nr:hypothetical protein BGX34_005497 [Mortierella sp. NVP85]